MGDYTLFGKDVPIKSLRGNNGNFNMLNPNIYKGIIPLVFGLSAYNVINNNQ